MLSKIFPNNVHIIDRALRIVIGLGLLSLVFIGPQSYWGLVGILPIITGLVGTCPVYTLFGISACKSCSGGASASTVKG
jgi:hypothetical protein